MAFGADFWGKIKGWTSGLAMPSMGSLFKGARARADEMLRLLLARGLSPDYSSWQNLRFLHLLCSRDVRNRTMSHRTECAGILLDAGAAISARDEEYRSTPLAWAARNKSG